MANVFSNLGTDFDNLNLTGFHDLETYVYSNNPTMVHGIEYATIYKVVYDNGTRSSIIGGPDITLNQATGALSGTVTGYFESIWDGSTFQTSWGVENINVSAAALWNASLTASNADDLAILQQALSGDDNFNMSPQSDNVNGFEGNDVLNGGAGSDTLAGGAGADTFVFDQTALTPAQPGSAVFDHILDYNQGNSGTFNLAEGDTFDFSGLLSAGSGQHIGDLVRVLENPSGTGAILQVDQDGIANGAHWTTVARLDGVHTGDGVKVIFDASQPAATLTVPGLVPTHNFDGDSRADILGQNDSGLPAIWTVDGTNMSGGTALPDPGPAWHVKAAADFNGDGKSDILWQNDSGAPGIWTLDGTNISGIAALLDPGPTWHVKAAADFNGDGKADILWQNDSGLPAIWTMDGTNITGLAALPDVGPTWHVAAAADFNGDGKSDILWQNDSGLPAIWTMDGTNITGLAALPDPGPAWHVKAAADFNGDGKADILWQNGGLPAIWTMDGTNVTGGAGLPDVGPTWHVAAAADFNGDGKADILWQNDGGLPAIWTMDGTNVTDAAVLPNPGHDWHLV